MVSRTIRNSVKYKKTTVDDIAMCTHDTKDMDFEFYLLCHSIILYRSFSDSDLLQTINARCLLARPYHCSAAIEVERRSQRHRFQCAPSTITTRNRGQVWCSALVKPPAAVSQGAVGRVWVSVVVVVVGREIHSVRYPSWIRDNVIRVPTVSKVTGNVQLVKVSFVCHMKGIKFSRVPLQGLVWLDFHP